MTDINGAVALVTGGSRGIGAAIVQELLDRGAAKVYATARNPEHVKNTDERVVPLALEVTDPASIAAVAAATGDVTVLINNAGSGGGGTFLDGDLDEIRSVVEANFFGPIQLVRALVPTIEGNGGGQILTIASALSWISFAAVGAYSASKAAVWSFNDGLRLELADRGIGVTGLHVGLVDTDMTDGWPGDKSAPSDVAVAAVDGIEAGAHEVLVDETARGARGSLTASVEQRYPELAGTPVG